MTAHPRHELDEIIHAPVRLSIVAALAAAEKADFRFLRDTIEVSDSLLSKHVLTLEEAGYVRVEKTFVGKRGRTWLSLTERGRAAFENYMDVLRRIMEATPRA
ncbi:MULTISPECIES: winged helix-turn-helix domain-containing protein [Microbispora]|uniref:Helix-turn-helix domain-containing protein n=3 Tax=Microbispora TaxID=2005 RepID=A0ABY3LNS1_9ACTN|nr:MULTISPECIES: transcriptional regulator [Microbispora]GLW21521.1 MarR family transcriptional regulator [Microbispora amethystogenes]MBO4272482.1 helix-turn-helix domain-containing protein [Microbispora triticiradicis]RGA01566.1 transcriptional regulator [Microbispora triticiradicis]TLP58813.1 transcriptional regulator [Microbispora fusca]TYB45088.1 helix-turn-helix domain-containing protein [Microbispora tritici]